MQTYLTVMGLKFSDGVGAWLDRYFVKLGPLKDKYRAQILNLLPSPEETTVTNALLKF